MKGFSIQPVEFFFLFMLMGMIWVLYYPALLGSRFIVDDYANLQQLSEVGIYGYASYVFSGISSSLGRPLSLLSFALQYQSWPHNAFAFKAVNLFIHMLNATLVFFILRKLSGHLKFSGTEITIVSCSVTALWLLHPMQLTTTLYVIQRMTELSAFFTLSGILLYLHCRPFVMQDTLSIKGIISGLCIYIFLLLAVLCKENGILLPLFILIIETTLYGQDKYGRAGKIWAWIFLGVPLLLLCLYFIINLDGLLAVYKYRTFTVYERLLTETVILFDYLYKILLPHPSAFTLFHDDFPISTGIFHPPVTFLSICSLAVLLTVVFVKRVNWPIISFGIFWFIGGHLLESSFLGLELYFEHRNYLPSMGILFMLVGTLMTAARKIGKKRHVLIFIGLYQLALIAITVMEIRLWASPLVQATEWVRNHPHSPRALGRLGDAYIITDDINGAIREYKHIAMIYPDEVYPELKQVALRACARDEQIPDEDWQKLFVKAAHATVDSFSNLAELFLIVSVIRDHGCHGINTTDLNKLIIILAENPRFKSVKSHLYDQASLLALYTGDVHMSLYYVQQSINASNSVPRELFKAELLFAMGDMVKARDTIVSVENKLQGNNRARLAYHERLSNLKKEMEKSGR